MGVTQYYTFRLSDGRILYTNLELNANPTLNVEATNFHPVNIVKESSWAELIAQGTIVEFHIYGNFDNV